MARPTKESAGRRMMEAALGPTVTAVKLARGAASTVIDALGHVGRLVGEGMGLDALALLRTGRVRKPPGASPGFEADQEAKTPPAPGAVEVQCIDYGPTRLEIKAGIDLDSLLREPRPDWVQVRWININGLHPFVVNLCVQHFKLHTLAAEDVLNTSQRPKLEDYADHLFLVLRMLSVDGRRLNTEQISLFFFRDTLITFQETPGDVWDPIRQRLQSPTSRLRTQGAAYLVYALLDAVVDHCFPILEGYGELLEDMEAAVLEDPRASVQRRIHAIKRELILIRRLIWPLRDVLNALQRDENGFLNDFVRTYLRDVYDHTIQVIDIVETYREMAGGLNDLYMSSVGNRMNEIMKVLTIMASLFIPITFLAGVYGMNFEHIPEISWPYSYPVFWLVCLSIVGALLVYFQRKGWIGRS